MSNSSSPPTHPSQLEQSTHVSDVVCEGPQSPNEETLDQPGPEINHPPQPALDPEDNSPDVEDDGGDEDGEEIDEGKEKGTPVISSVLVLPVDPPIDAAHALHRDVSLASAFHDPVIRRGGGSKRKKGKGKGKPSTKKKLAIEEKVQTLMAGLNPIPFIPHKILDFAKHEKLLRKLGLWDFVHIDFDRVIRVDLIAQLIVTYNPKTRCSYVNNGRIAVSRADLARSFKFPRKKGNAGAPEVDLDCDSLSDDSIGFMVEFVSDWVLLHEDDAWLMPKEVMDWLKVIRDGHPEKVDWASLFWFMVERELKQGGQLRDCHYASHLQHLMKFQRVGLFLTAEPVVKYDEVDAKEEGYDVNEGVVSNVHGRGEINSCLMEGPSTKLTLGQDGENEEEGMKNVEMMDIVKCKDSDDDEEEEEEREEEEQGQWLLCGKNNLGEHFMQRCGAENAEEFESFEEKKEEEEEIDEDENGDEEGNKFSVFPSDDALEGVGGYTGNLLQAMEANEMAFNPHDQIRGQSSMDIRADMAHIGSVPSFFNNSGKRVIEHDDNQISHHHSDVSNKKLRMINDSWDHNKPVDFGACMEQIQHVTERARMLYEEKEQALEHSNMNQHLLLTELQRRDSVIEHLHKTRLEDVQKKDGEIYRLERELCLMGSVLEGYRKALKETQRAFSEYKEKAKLVEEPTYKDVGPGGLMLPSAEIEKLRRRQEEEYNMSCLIAKQKLKEIEEHWAGQFDLYVEKVNVFEKRLTGLGDDAREIIELYKKRKSEQPEEAAPEVDGFEPRAEEEEEEVREAAEEEEEVHEAAEEEEEVHEAAEEEEGREAGESVSTPQIAEENVSEVEENQTNP